MGGARLTPAPNVTLERLGGRLVAHYRMHLFRFLMSDGKVVDVEAAQDSSELRHAVLEALPTDDVSVAAVVRLGDADTVPPATRST
jgi:hypothetical protein